MLKDQTLIAELPLNSPCKRPKPSGVASRHWEPADIASLLQFFKLLHRIGIREKATMRPCCSKCGGPAEYTLNVIVSTLGISPAWSTNEQDCPVLFCLYEYLVRDLCVPKVVRVFLEVVNTAYTTLTDAIKTVDNSPAK